MPCECSPIIIVVESIYSYMYSDNVRIASKEKVFLQMLDLWPYVEDSLQALQPCCSLEELLYHQEKLVRLQQLVLEGADLTALSSLEGCMAPLKVCQIGMSLITGIVLHHPALHMPWQSALVGSDDCAVAYAVVPFKVN